MMHEVRRRVISVKDVQVTILKKAIFMVHPIISLFQDLCTESPGDRHHEHT